MPSLLLSALEQVELAQLRATAAASAAPHSYERGTSMNQAGGGRAGEYLGIDCPHGPVLGRVYRRELS